MLGGFSVGESEHATMPALVDSIYDPSEHAPYPILECPLAVFAHADLSVV